MISTWISLSTTQVSLVPTSQIILPKMTHDSVDETLIEVFMLWKLCGARVCVVGRSTSLRSPRVANSKHRFCRVSLVWLTISTSTRLRMRKDLVFNLRNTYPAGCQSHGL